MDKIKEFETEIGYIKEDRIKKDACYLIEKLPEYFFNVPASSSGKYHPIYASKEKGLLKHTKAAVRIAHELLENPIIGNCYSATEKDIIIFGLIIHDGFKMGEKKQIHTIAEHPLISMEFVEKNKNNLSLNEHELDFLERVIASHMGIWNKNYQGKEILPIPETKEEILVHICDYLASRKCISFEFDEQNNIKN